MRPLSSALGVALASSLVFTLVTAEQAPAPAAPAPPAAPGQAGPAAPARGAGGGLGQAAGSAATQSAGGQLIALVPKQVNPPRWVAPNKPWTKLSEVLAAHKGQTDWTHRVVTDQALEADWISMGPGKKTPKRANDDTREWWIVWDGEVKFTIDGQEPFIAKKGYMVQVPYRNFYQMETVGDTPSLRLEVNVANQAKIYPLDETPTPRDGYTFIRSRVGGAKGAYDERSKMFVNFFDDVLPTGRGGAFVSDVRSFCNIIIGNPQNEPAPTDRGHFHQESGEFWLIMSGKIRYRLEDATKFGTPEVFEADPGDVVYAPRQTWHLASVGGVGTNERGTRIAMNGYPDLAHNYEAPSGDAPARGAGPGRGGRGAGRGTGQGQ